MEDVYPVSHEILEKQLKIFWSDEHEGIHSHKSLRESCPCAACKGEGGLFGRVEIPPKPKVSDDIKPLKLDPVGRYAISIQWNDGHSTGIYKFEYLRDLCQCSKCQPK